MIKLYHLITSHCAPFLIRLLNKRVTRGKEIPERLHERMGAPAMPRPDRPLIWLHAASVGEAQSALILIKALLKEYQDMHLLVTTGTVTSANMMIGALPDRAFHQFYPLDHPNWVKGFLDHWQPDLALWMESELWPNMLMALSRRTIPAALVNARLSNKSYRYWWFLRGSVRTLLKTFSTILCQTNLDTKRYRILGGQTVQTTNNLKYSAGALRADEHDLSLLNAHIMNRPVWLYASSHKGEETLATRIHERLKAEHPDLLTIIVPRHISRRDDIKSELTPSGLNITFRGAQKAMPTADTDIYIADTMGELGLFYRIAPLAVIGRSFSDDGGGGHNPIEAAQLNCAVLYGPNVQYQTEIFEHMSDAQAAIQVMNENDLEKALRHYLGDKKALKTLQSRGQHFAQSKSRVIDTVINALQPVLKQAKITL